jgi:hypothetical protein
MRVRVSSNAAAALSFSVRRATRLSAGAGGERGAEAAAVELCATDRSAARQAAASPDDGGAATVANPLLARLARGPTAAGGAKPSISKVRSPLVALRAQPVAAAVAGVSPGAAAPAGRPRQASVMVGVPPLSPAGTHQPAPAAGGAAWAQALDPASGRPYWFSDAGATSWERAGEM